LRWMELSVTTSPEFVEPLSEIFYRYGHGGVAIEEAGGYNPDEGETPPLEARVTVRTYLPLNATAALRRDRIDLGVRLVAQIGPVSSLQERVLDRSDWRDAWHEHFNILRIGRRTVIVPSWKTYQAEPGDSIIRLDPGMAFGTGHHPTTKACLELLEQEVEQGTAVLDVGCGSGILSISAARLGATSVLALDIEASAVHVARRNVRDNGVQHFVRVAQGSLPNDGVYEGSYDVAVANISSKVVCEIAQHLAQAVKPCGRIIASGFLEEKKEAVVAAFAREGAGVESIIVEGEWATVLLVREGAPA